MESNIEIIVHDKVESLKLAAKMIGYDIDYGRSKSENVETKAIYLERSDGSSYKLSLHYVQNKLMYVSVDIEEPFYSGQYNIIENGNRTEKNLLKPIETLIELL